jgi:hypothetical protein
MDTTSQQKVIAAGFTIIRADDQPNPRVKVKDKRHRKWAALYKFETKAARDRYMTEQLKSPHIITD